MSGEREAETAIQELRRLVRQFEDSPAGSSVAEDTWNYIADCVTSRIHELEGAGTLRDHFAGQALTGLLASTNAAQAAAILGGDLNEVRGRVAGACYRMANAMLKARARQGTSDHE